MYFWTWYNWLGIWPLRPFELSWLQREFPPHHQIWKNLTDNLIFFTINQTRSLYHHSSALTKLSHTDWLTLEDLKVTQEWSQWASFDSKSCLHNQGNHIIKKRSWKTHALINTLKTNDSAKLITYKNWSTLRLPRVDGISPVKLLFAKSKFSKLVRFPNSVGISPVMWFPGNTLHDKWNQYKLGLHLKENCSNICQWLENITTHKFPTEISNR